LLAGPLLTREAMTAPRHIKLFLIRAGYLAAFVVLMYTAGQATFERRPVQTLGDSAAFGRFLFDLFAMVQLTLAAAAALLFCSSSVSQEKDRRTLVLLLMTDLKNFELVAGKLAASLLLVVMLIGVSLPVFALLSILGGISAAQIFWVEAICLSTAALVGSWSILVAYWRDKTFQTLATCVIGGLLFVGLVEVISAVGGPSLAVLADTLNPYRAMANVLDPLASQVGVVSPQPSALWPVVMTSGLAAILGLVTMVMVRVWNPSRFAFDQLPEPTPEERAAAAAQELSPATNSKREHREIWNLPVLWREICTRAYGRKMIFVKLAYFVLAGFIVFNLSQSYDSQKIILGMMSPVGFAFASLSLVSLILVNAQAVTSLTSERDAQTLELLLVTNVTAKEFVFGKLGGVLFNAKEVIIVPLFLLFSLALRGEFTMESTFYVIISYLVLVAFSAMVGLHAGLSYGQSRAAIANSLGTVFFLFVGIFVCMMLIVEARSSFELQLTPFLVFILGGGLGLWASLSHKNPSPALMIASGLLPFLTFYAITGYLIGGTLGVALSVVAAYGFTTLAMLVPAIGSFDVALGRSSADKG
jgi:ABC-type transport system involved in multi-copper enzyme maturation permease subunit